VKKNVFSPMVAGWRNMCLMSLEEYDLTMSSQEIRDLQKSVEVKALNGGTRNELDVAFLSNNHFHVVECKTKTWKEEDSVSDAIYKLDTLKETPTRY
jgi:hypothetical protein